MEGRKLAFWLWALIGCPVCGLIVLLFVGSDGQATKFFVIFCVFPALLALFGGIGLQQSAPLVISLSLVSGVLGVLVWGALILIAAASGAYDTSPDHRPVAHAASSSSIEETLTTRPPDDASAHRKERRDSRSADQDPPGEGRA